MSDGAANLELWFRVGNFALVLIGIGGVLVKISSLATRFEMVGNQTQKEIAELKTNVSELQKVITVQAVSTRMIENLQDELKELRGEVKDLRRGKGFIQEAIDGEYPRR